MNEVRVPEKYFYTIGDVSKLTGTKQHVLRYWESQFKLLKPARRYSGHRKYTQREIDIVNKIKYLVIERRFTLAGAKREIARQLSTKPVQPMEKALSAAPEAVLRDLKKDVDECLAMLRPTPVQQELLKV